MEQETARKTETDVTGQVVELVRQTNEMRNQLIKAGNSITSLSAEFRDFGKQLEAQQRRMTFNSAVAYVLFVIIVGIAFYFTYRSKIERLDFEKETLVRERAAAQNLLDSMRKAQEKRREAEEQAAAFYRLTQTGQVPQALKRYSEIGQLPLSRVEAAVFQDWVTRNRNRLAYSAYTAAMKAVGENNWKKAASEFQNALSYVPQPPQEASLRYYLGISLMKLGSYQEATDELERSLNVDAEKLVATNIRFQLGSIYEQMGRQDKAKKSYQDFIRLHPGDKLANAARRRLKDLP